MPTPCCATLEAKLARVHRAGPPQAGEHDVVVVHARAARRRFAASAIPVGTSPNMAPAWGCKSSLRALSTTDRMASPIVPSRLATIKPVSFSVTVPSGKQTVLGRRGDGSR
jgi:hypothetical protein